MLLRPRSRSSNSFFHSQQPARRREPPGAIADVLEGKFIILRKGKRSYTLVKLV
jgi:hypothetical protein